MAPGADHGTRQLEIRGKMVRTCAVWSKYSNALLYHRFRFYHDARFNLNFMAFWPILITNVRRLTRVKRGMDWKKLLGSITESVDEELRLRNAYLAAENRLFRQQLRGQVH